MPHGWPPLGLGREGLLSDLKQRASSQTRHSMSLPRLDTGPPLKLDTVGLLPGSTQRSPLRLDRGPPLRLDTGGLLQGRAQDFNQEGEMSPGDPGNPNQKKNSSDLAHYF